MWDLVFILDVPVSSSRRLNISDKQQYGAHTVVNWVVRGGLGAGQSSQCTRAHRHTCTRWSASCFLWHSRGQTGREQGKLIKRRNSAVPAATLPGRLIWSDAVPPPDPFGHCRHLSDGEAPASLFSSELGAASQLGPPGAGGSLPWLS